MDRSKSTTTISQIPSHFNRLQRTASTISRTISTILITSRAHLAFHGPLRKKSLFARVRLTLVFIGTLIEKSWACLTRRRLSTWMHLVNGLNLGHTTSKTRKSYTASCYIHARLSPLEELASLHWRGSWASSPILLTCHVHPPRFGNQTCSGGKSDFRDRLWSAQFLAQSNSSTYRPTPMPAPRLESGLSSTEHGELRDSKKDGKVVSRGETSPGRRQSVSKFSSEPFYLLYRNLHTSKLTVTTKLSLKDGESVEVTTKPSTTFSNDFINSAKTTKASFISGLFRAPSIPQTVPREEDSFRDHSSPFPTSLRRSQPTYASMMKSKMIHSPSFATKSTTYFRNHQHKRKHWKKTTNSMKLVSNLYGRKFFGTSNAAKASKPKALFARMAPTHSPLRPHCLAGDRLSQWLPSQARQKQNTIILSSRTRSSIHRTLNASWHHTTKRTYGAGLTAFHVFCDKEQITESDRAPCSSDLLAGFVASLAGLYSGKTIRNYVAGVRAWHLMHRLPWQTDELELNRLLTGADKLTPPSSVRPPREPITVDYIATIREQLDISKPLDAAFYACLTIGFYSCIRLGEFTVPKASDFSSKIHVTNGNVHEEIDRSGNLTTVIHLPWTKTHIAGEDVSFAAQEGPTDPVSALINHRAINNPHEHHHLFAYKTTQGRMLPMTRNVFLNRLKHAASAAGLPCHSGHSIRIGSTLEYLLRGLSFETIKVLGRWKSDAFRAYLRKHGKILAPYLQKAPPTLHSLISKFTTDSSGIR